jgi:hypothetical protein
MIAKSAVFHRGERLDLLHCEQAKSVASPSTPPGRHTPPCFLVIFLSILSQIFPPSLIAARPCPPPCATRIQTSVSLTLATATVSLMIATIPIVVILSASPSALPMALVFPPSLLHLLLQPHVLVLCRVHTPQPRNHQTIVPTSSVLVADCGVFFLIAQSLEERHCCCCPPPPAPCLEYPTCPRQAL